MHCVWFTYSLPLSGCVHGNGMCWCFGAVLQCAVWGRFKCVSTCTRLLTVQLSGRSLATISQILQSTGEHVTSRASVRDLYLPISIPIKHSKIFALFPRIIRKKAKECWNVSIGVPPLDIVIMCKWRLFLTHMHTHTLIGRSKLGGWFRAVRKSDWLKDESYSDQQSQ